jgi:hypothetical protein
LRSIGQLPQSLDDTEHNTDIMADRLDTSRPNLELHHEPSDQGERCLRAISDAVEP